MDFQTGTLLVGIFFVAAGLIWLNVKIRRGRKSDSWGDLKERDNG